MKTLIESHIIEDKTGQLRSWSLTSRKLFNKTREYLEVNPKTSYSDLDKIFKHDSLYKKMPKAQSAQQTLKLSVQNRKSYEELLKEWAMGSNRMAGAPKPYKASKRPYALIFTNQCSQIKNGQIVLSKTLKIPYSGKIEKYQQIRIKHLKGDTFKLEIVYREQEKIIDDTHIHYMGIDLGLSVIASIGITDGSNYLVSSKELRNTTNRYDFLTSNNTIQTEGDKKYVISKSKNKHGFKKFLRNKDQMHKISRRIVDLAMKKKIKTIVIGHNWDWTRQTNIGRANNRMMSSFGLKRLIDYITYKAELCGMKVVLQEESYTSKCDFMMNEPIKKRTIYSGKRVTRSGFLSGIGKVIHADINAAFNMIRKHIDVSAPRDKILYEEIQKKGQMYCPSKLAI